MNIKYLIATLLIVFCSQIFGQKMIAQYKGFNSKWGYVASDGVLVTKPIFNDCEPFNNGLARVDNNKFITASGEELNIAFKIQEARNFSGGYAAVMIKGKWGLMNVRGELIIPANYNMVSDFNEGYALGITGEELFIFDSQGSSIEIKMEEGKFIEKGKLFSVRPFSGGLAAFSVDLYPGPNDELRFGFINTKGEVVIKPEYRDVGNFEEEITWFKTLNGEIGFYDKSGKIVVEPKYLAVGDFYNGMAWYRVKGGDIGFINTKGEEVIAPQFKAVGNFDPVSGLARVEIGKGEKGYVNVKGEFKFFKNTKIFKHFTEGLCVEEKNKLVGFIDNTGEWVIEPKFKVATPFKNGYSKVKMFVNRKNMWGIIDKKGEYVIEPKFMNIYEFYSAD